MALPSLKNLGIEPQNPVILPQAGAFSLGAMRTQKADVDYDVSEIKNAIGQAESRGEKEPYKFSRFSNRKDLGNVLGKYQVTEGELKSYSKKYLGKDITTNDFLNNSQLQETYMDNKISDWKKMGIDLDNIISNHRGGLNSRIEDYKSYIDSVKSFLPERSSTLTSFESPKVKQASQPKAGVNINPVRIARDIQTGIMKSGAAIGLTLAKRPELPEYPKGTIERKVKDFLFGEEAVKSLATRIAEGEQKAQQFGIGKLSLPTSFLVVGGLTGLDFTGVGGPKKVGEQLLKETGEEAISALLKKIGTADELLPKFSKVFSRANTPEAVSEGLSLLAKESESLNVVGKAISKAGEEVSKATAKLPKKELAKQLPKQELRAEDIFPQLGQKGSLPPSVSLRPIKSIGEDIKEATSQLIRAIRTAARPARVELERLKSEELSKRVGAVAGIFERGEGEKGYFQALSKLKGELTPAEKRAFILKRERSPSIKPRVFRNTDKVGELREEIGILEYTIERSPIRQLSKYAGRNRELPEVVGYGKNRFAKEGDQIVTELGFRDSEEARLAYEKYIQSKDQLQSLKEQLREVRKETFIDYTQEQLGKINRLFQKASQNIEGLLKNELGEESVQKLFRVAQLNPNLDIFERLNTQTALVKILNGIIPTNSELRLLENTFGKKLVDTILEQRTLGQKLLGGFQEAINLPRTIMSSFDLSAPFRQGLMLLSHPKAFGKSFTEMFKMFGSDKAFKATMEGISKMPEYELMKSGRLAITDIGRFMGTREEAFAASWAEKIPVLKYGVRASNRAYTGFLNKLRADVFSDIIRGARNAGKDVSKGSQLVNDIASFVNAASGRGGLGAIERVAPVLNGLFFSPRLMASRIYFMNPVNYIKADPTIRKEMLKSVFTVVGSGLTVLGIASAAGLKVGDEPRSSDWGKIIIGKTRIDIWGGFQQYARMIAQLITGEYVSSVSGKKMTLGEGYKPLTRFDILLRQIESKEAPIASFITALLKQQDYAGKPVNVPEEVGKRFIPMVLGDIYELAKINPNLLPVELLGIFGFGIQTYESRPAAGTGKGIPGLPKSPLKIRSKTLSPLKGIGL